MDWDVDFGDGLALWIDGGFLGGECSWDVDYFKI